MIRRRPWRIRTSSLPIVGAVLVSALLVGSVLYIREQISQASSLVTRGLFDGLHSDARATFREYGFPPSAPYVQEFLEEHFDEGLRYFAVLDEHGQVLVSAGEPSRGWKNERSYEQSGTRIRQLVRLGGRGPQRPDEPPPRAQGEPRPRRPRVTLVYELEPVPALELQAQARRLLILAGLVSVMITALAVALSRVLAQRERMQAELERGRRLAALGEMSAVLAHELRNPLASLKGHAQLLAETVEGDGRMQPKVTRLVDETIRLERSMTDLLEFVRSGELQKATVDANEVLRSAVAATGSERIAPRYLPKPLHLPLDPGRVQQALENVLRNALQAADGERQVEAEVAVSGEDVLFRIRDHGPGIARGDEERIFEPFVTGKVRGVGLGLAITRRIIEQHGGKVAVSNHPQGGAEFRLSVPRQGG